jgi:RecA-family ATPase
MFPKRKGTCRVSNFWEEQPGIILDENPMQLEIDGAEHEAILALIRKQEKDKKNRKSDSDMANSEAVDCTNYRFVSASAWAGKPVPKREWCVPNWVPSRVVTLFSGHGGIGKTITLLQLLEAKASGGQWFENELTKAPALGVFAEEEEEDEIQRRLAGICEGSGADLARLDCLDLMCLADGDSALFAPSRHGGLLMPTQLFDIIKERALDIGAKLITLDPAADPFGGDEINRREVGEFLSGLRGLAIAIDGAVVLAVHPSREGMKSGTGYSGPTGWHNKARSLIYMLRPDAEAGEHTDNDKREIRHLKSNMGPMMEPLTLRWNNGAYVSETAPYGMVAAIENQVIERDFLGALDRLTAQGIHVTNAPNSPRFAPKAMRKTGGLEHSKHKLADAMNRLFRDETIIVGSVRKPDRHMTTAIVRKGLKR